MARFWRRRPSVSSGGPSTGDPEAPVEVAESRRRLAGILEHVEEGVLLLNGTRVRWLNPAARLMFPALEQPVGRPLVEVVREHRIDGLALRARESRLEQAAEVELPISGRILQIRAVPLHDGDLILLARDITRLRYLETVRQQFVANLSHEIRTPLAGLDLAAQTLSAELPADGDIRLFIDRITQEAGRLADIVFRETTTIGLRYYDVDRECLRREVVTVETPVGAVRFKIAWREGRVINAAPEFEDVSRLAADRNLSVKEVQALAVKAYGDRS